jgi:hypothetical protein
VPACFYLIPIFNWWHHPWYQLTRWFHLPACLLLLSWWMLSVEPSHVRQISSYFVLTPILLLITLISLLSLS